MTKRFWKLFLGAVVGVFALGGIALSSCGTLSVNPVMWSVSWYSFLSGPREYMLELEHLCSFKPVTREDVMGTSSTESTDNESGPAFCTGVDCVVR